MTEDHTPGSHANHDADDVDAPSPGVILTSPPIPVPPNTSALVDFAMWYASENAGIADTEVVVEWVRLEGQTETVTELAKYKPGDSSLRWQRRRVLVDDTLADVGTQVMLRFRFVDVPPLSILEGGIDQVVVTWVSGCVCCDGDYNRDGSVDQDDVTYLLNAVSGGSNPTCTDVDFNHDGNGDQDDVAALINKVGGGGCP